MAKKKTNTFREKKRKGKGTEVGGEKNMKSDLILKMFVRIKIMDKKIDYNNSVLNRIPFNMRSRLYS